MGVACCLLDQRVDNLVQEVARLATIRDRGRLVTLPAVEPAHGVVTIALEDVTAVEHPVIVAQQHLAFLHRAARDVLLRHLVDVVERLGVDLGEIPHEDVGHAHLWHCARPAVSQVARVVVYVAEPQRAARLGVAVYGRLLALDRLQPVRLAVRAVQHLEVHVELGGDHRADEVLGEVERAVLERAEARKDVEVEVRHRDADLLVVEPLEDARVHVAEDRVPVGDKEFATLHSCRLEAHECTKACGLLGGGLVVKADVVACE
mmetsp:Transcript_6295/g.16082  ORF Transcript_6295/g.16082 Transcript_6295/m.16082 type:complete len:262 (+) Transcript_6295:189-974(+)